MAQSVKINNTTYSSVPSVQIPLSSGSGNATFYDTSDATASAAYLLSGYTAYSSSGLITGTMSAVSVSQDSSSKILTIS